MTDQAVDTDGAAAGGAMSPTRTRLADVRRRAQFVGRRRELKELRADIDRAGLDTLSGRKAPRARVLLIAGRPGSGRTALAEELVAAARRRLPRRGAARPAHRTRRHPGPHRTHRPRPARRPRRAGARPAPTRTSSPRRSARPSPTAGPCCSSTTRRDAEQVDPLLPDAPDCLVVAVAERPAHRHPRRPALHARRPGHRGRASNSSPVRAGPVRITVDPRSAESLVEACAAPARRARAGRRLARRAAQGRRRRPRQAACATGPRRAPRPRAGLPATSYASLPAPAARILRLLALAPAGHVDPHTASALAGCSVSAARTTLDDFVAARPASGP